MLGCNASIFRFSNSAFLFSGEWTVNITEASLQQLCTRIKYKNIQEPYRKLKWYLGVMHNSFKIQKKLFSICKGDQNLPNDKKSQFKKEMSQNTVPAIIL